MQEDFRFCWSQVARRVRCLLLVSSAVSLLLARLEDIFLVVQTWHTVVFDPTGYGSIWSVAGTGLSGLAPWPWSCRHLQVVESSGSLAHSVLGRSPVRATGGRGAACGAVGVLAPGASGTGRHGHRPTKSRVCGWQWRTSSAGGDLRRSGRRPSWPGRRRSRRFFQRGCSGCSGVELSWSGAPGGPTA